MIEQSILLLLLGMGSIFVFMIIFIGCTKLLRKIIHIFRLDRDVYPNPDFFYKYDAFKKFYKKSKPYFRFIHSRDKTAQEISKQYFFYVCPGGSNGGLNENVVEVFWGQMPYSSSTTIDNRLNINRKILVERGAILYYTRLDNGNVVVTLYPAKTENTSPFETEIIIDYITNPCKLLDISVLRKHWRYFKAYMDITSLRGLHTVSSRIIE